MIRKIFLAVVAMIALLTVSSCGNSKVTNEDAAPVASKLEKGERLTEDDYRLMADYVLYAQKCTIDYYNNDDPSLDDILEVGSFKYEEPFKTRLFAENPVALQERISEIRENDKVLDSLLLPGHDLPESNISPAAVDKLLNNYK